jgi:citrate synthase
MTMGNENVRSAAPSGGLDGIVVADTTLSHVDGELGRLVIAGHDVERLAAKSSFEEGAALLWSVRPERVRSSLGTARVEAFARLRALGDALARRDGMDALRGALAHLVPTDAGGDPVDDAVRLTAATAVFASAWARSRAGAPAVAPDPSRGHAEDFLRTTTGSAPTPEVVRALDAYLVTVSDHGMNASTFAARVVASTGSDMVSAVVAAVGALKGPLHGGAPGPVLDMLDAIGTAGAADTWVRTELDAGRRIMGMGHRVYRVRDPRAAVLERAIEALEAAGVAKGKLALARAVERTAESVLAARHPDRPLKANVEFFTAVLLDAIGLPRDAFTTTFAVGRVAGWCAHVIEQRANGRLIRPASRYVGALPALGA